VIIRAKRLHPDARLPTKSRPNDAGFDLVAIHDATVSHDRSTVVDTGVALEIVEGFYGQIFGRSGLAARGIAVHPGVVDSSYRGSVRVVLWNASFAEYEVKAGDKIGQMVILPVPQISIEECDELSPSERNEAGWGSSGR
jgi:dUTP pyrophosphatase